jgi:hypothetical protein
LTRLLALKVETSIWKFQNGAIQKIDRTAGVLKVESKQLELSKWSNLKKRGLLGVFEV